MAYKTDHYPIEYLQRRVIYYKKSRAATKSPTVYKHLSIKYTAEEIKVMQAKRLAGIDHIIEQFELAIEILKCYQFHTTEQ